MLTYGGMTMVKTVTAMVASTSKIDLMIDGLSDAWEETPGAIIWRNSDFSKEVNHEDDDGHDPIEPGSRRDPPDYPAKDRGEADLLDPQYQTDFTHAVLTLEPWMVNYYDLYFEFDDE